MLHGGSREGGGMYGTAGGGGGGGGGSGKYIGGRMGRGQGAFLGTGIEGRKRVVQVGRFSPLVPEHWQGAPVPPAPGRLTEGR